MPTATATLTEPDYLTRRRACQAAIREATAAYETASRRAATGQCSDDEQRQAQSDLNLKMDKLAGLEAAWTDQCREDRRAAAVAEHERWEATKAEVEIVVGGLNRRTAAVDELAQQADELVDEVAADCAKLRELLSRHRLTKSIRPGDPVTLRDLNLGSVARIKEARSAAYGVRNIAQTIAWLEDMAAGSLGEVEPARLEDEE
jgi:hypothetical protein